MAGNFLVSSLHFFSAHFIPICSSANIVFQLSYFPFLAFIFLMCSALLFTSPKPVICRNHCKLCEAILQITFRDYSTRDKARANNSLGKRKAPLTPPSNTYLRVSALNEGKNKNPQGCQSKLLHCSCLSCWEKKRGGNRCTTDTAIPLNYCPSAAHTVRPDTVWKLKLGKKGTRDIYCRKQYPFGVLEEGP